VSVVRHGAAVLVSTRVTTDMLYVARSAERSVGVDLTSADAGRWIFTDLHRSARSLESRD
jgi:hypothetical protein